MFRLVAKLVHYIKPNNGYIFACDPYDEKRVLSRRGGAVKTVAEFLSVKAIETLRYVINDL